MEKILSKYEVKLANSCFLGCLTDMYNAINDTNIEEERIFGLECDLDFQLHNSGDCKDCMICYASFDFENLKTKHLKTMGFIIERISCDNYAEIMRVIRFELSNNRPCMLSVNIKELNYYPLRLRIDNSHFINIYGVDERNGVVYVADNSITTVPRSIYKGTVLMPCLENSVREANFPYTIYVYRKAGKAIVLDKEVSFNSLIRSCNVFLQRNSVNTQKCFIKSIREEAEQMPRELFIETLKKKHRSTALGGPHTSFLLFQKYLQLIQRKGYYNMEPYIVLLNEICSGWSMITNQLLKIALTENLSLLDRINDKLVNILHCEVYTILQLNEYLLTEGEDILITNENHSANK